MSDHSDQGLPQGVDGHSPSGTDNLRSGSFTSPVAVNTDPSDPGSLEFRVFFIWAETCKGNMTPNAVHTREKLSGIDYA